MSIWKQLPNELWQHIYSYDDTYRHIFTTQVLIELWHVVWQRWKQTMLQTYLQEDLRFHMCFNYLFQDVLIPHRHFPTDIYLSSNYRNLEYYHSTMIMDNLVEDDFTSFHPLYVRICIEDVSWNVHVECVIHDTLCHWFMHEFPIGNIVYHEYDYSLRVLS